MDLIATQAVIRGAQYESKKSYFRCRCPLIESQTCSFIGTFSDIIGHTASHWNCHLFTCKICGKCIYDYNDIFRHQNARNPQICPAAPLDMAPNTNDRFSFVDLWKFRNIYVSPATKADFLAFKRQGTTKKKTSERDTRRTPSYDDDDDDLVSMTSGRSCMDSVQYNLPPGGAPPRAQDFRNQGQGSSSHYSSAPYEPLVPFIQHPPPIQQNHYQNPPPPFQQNQLQNRPPSFQQNQFQNRPPPPAYPTRNRAPSRPPAPQESGYNRNRSRSRGPDEDSNRGTYNRNQTSIRPSRGGYTPSSKYGRGASGAAQSSRSSGSIFCRSPPENSTRPKTPSSTFGAKPSSGTTSGGNRSFGARPPSTSESTSSFCRSPNSSPPRASDRNANLEPLGPSDRNNNRPQSSVLQPAAARTPRADARPSEYTGPMTHSQTPVSEIPIPSRAAVLATSVPTRQPPSRLPKPRAESHRLPVDNSGTISIMVQRPEEIARHRRSSVAYRSQSRGRSMSREPQSEEVIEKRDLAATRQNYQVQGYSNVKVLKNTNRMASLISNPLTNAAPRAKTPIPRYTPNMSAAEKLRALRGLPSQQQLPSTSTAPPPPESASPQPVPPPAPPGITRKRVHNSSDDDEDRGDF